MTTQIERMWMVVPIAVALVALSHRALAVEKTPVVELTVNGAHFDLVRTTGTLVAVDPEGNTVVGYKAAYLDGDKEAVIGPVKVGQKPVGVVYKRYKGKDYIAVVCHDDHTMHILDAEKLSTINVVKLQGQYPSSVVASRDETDPMLFYPNGRGHESRANIVSLEDLSDRGKGYLEGAMDMAVSGDGRVAYKRGPWSPSGFHASRLTRNEDGKVEDSPLHHEHASTPAYLADPFGYHVAAGNNVYSHDLKRLVAKLNAPVVAFLDHQPVLLTLEGRDILHAVSTNTFKPLGRTSLPADYLAGKATGNIRTSNPSHADHKFIGYRQVILPDGARSRVIVAAGKLAATVPLSDFTYKPEPLLRAQVETPRSSVLANEPVTIPVKLLDRAATLSLKDAPKAMTYTDGVLRWTPTSADVGDVKVVLGIAAGDLAVTQEFTVTVTQRSLILEFRPGGLAISPDGKRVVAWSNPQQFGDFDANGGRRTDAGSRLAIVDLEKNRIVAERKLLFNATAVATDGELVYVGSAESSVCYVLKGADLSDVKRVFTNGVMQQLTVLTPNLMLARLQQGNTVTYELPKVEVTTLKGAIPEGQRAYDDGRGYLPLRVPGGWAWRGCVFDEDLKKVVMLQSMAGMSYDGRRGNAPSTWNRQAGPEGIINASNQALIGRFPGVATIVLPHRPVAATLSVKSKYISNSSRYVAELTLRDLLTATPRQVVPLLDQLVTNHNEFAGAQQLASAGDQLVALVGNRLFFYKIDPAELKGCDPPLHFEQKQDAFVIDEKSKVKLTHKLVGGELPYEFGLTIDRPGFTIDSKTGDVSVDGAQAIGPIASATIKMWLEGGMIWQEREDLDLTGEASVRKRIAVVNSPLESLLDRKFTGLAVPIPVSITALDKSQQTANVNYVLVADIPVEPLIKAAEEQRAKIEAMRRERDQPAGENGGPRVAELEARVRALEIKLDTVLRLLERRLDNSPKDKN